MYYYNNLACSHYVSPPIPIAAELKPNMPQALSNPGTIRTKTAKLKILNSGLYDVRLLLRNGPAGYEYIISPNPDLIQVITIADIRPDFNEFRFDLDCLGPPKNPMLPEYRVGCQVKAALFEYHE